jgi:hypothetical protein
MYLVSGFGTKVTHEVIPCMGPKSVRRAQLLPYIHLSEGTCCLLFTSRRRDLLRQGRVAKKRVTRGLLAVTKFLGPVSISRRVSQLSPRFENPEIWCDVGNV